MGIQDIIDEKRARVGVETPEQSNQQPGQTNRSPTIQLDLGGMDRDEMLFWMNVVQTVALVYIAMKLS